MLAGMAARAQVSPLNPTYTERELEPLLRDVEPRVLVCDGASIERGRGLCAATRRSRMSLCSGRAD